MRKILVLIGHYLPGFKDGGPVRTWSNVAEALGDEYDFRILTLDRDKGDESPYDGIRYDEWNVVGKAKVWYAKRFSVSLIRRLVKDVDVVYSCGFYDKYGYTALLLNKLGLLHGKQLVVAPMGNFSAGAIAQKAFKKKVFIGLFQAFGLFKKVLWSVTSSQEEADLKKHIKGQPHCVVAEDLPRVTILGRTEMRRAELPLRVIFLSRICAMKNLSGAIEMLQQVQSPVHFSIYGPAEDTTYWQNCQDLLAQLPSHITWEYKGLVHTDDVPATFQQHDVFLFPTLGENYGHVIFEALSAGCVPVISNRTPWQMIADRGAGFVLPLETPNAFAEAIDRLATMETSVFEAMAQTAVVLAQDKVEASIKETGYRRIFDPKS